jgi:hypothetical protein
MTMRALPPVWVRCFGCRHLRRRSACTEVGGLLYGRECAERARRASTWWCQLCGCLFEEEKMATATTCRLCEAGL